MANYLFSYDLNGQRPTHAEMDTHIQASGWANGRILETVWYIGTQQDPQTVVAYLRQILSANDSFALASCDQMTFDNLLVSEQSLSDAWSSYS